MGNDIVFGLSCPRRDPLERLGDSGRYDSLLSSGLEGRDDGMACRARGDCNGDGEERSRWCERGGLSGGKNGCSTSVADCGISGRGSETSGLWHMGDMAIPLSDESAADSMIRRCAMLLLFVLLFVDGLRGLIRLLTTVTGTVGGVRGSSASRRSTVGVRHECDGLVSSEERTYVGAVCQDRALSSPSLSVSTRGLRYLRGG